MKVTAIFGIVLAAMLLTTSIVSADVVFTENFDSYAEFHTLIPPWTAAGNSEGAFEVRNAGVGYYTSPPNMAQSQSAGLTGVYRSTGIDTNGSSKLVLTVSMENLSGSSVGQIALMPATATDLFVGNGWLQTPSALVMRYQNDVLVMASMDAAGGIINVANLPGASGLTVGAGNWWDFRITVSGLAGACTATLEYKAHGATDWTMAGYTPTHSTWSAGNIGLVSAINGVFDDVQLELVDQVPFVENFDAFYEYFTLTDAPTWTAAGNSFSPIYTRIFTISSAPMMAQSEAGSTADLFGGAYHPTGMDINGDSGVSFTFSAMAYLVGSRVDIALMPTTTTALHYPDLSTANGWMQTPSSLVFRMLGVSDGSTSIDLATWNASGGLVGYLVATGLLQQNVYDFRISTFTRSGACNVQFEYKLHTDTTWIDVGSTTTDSTWNAGNIGIMSAYYGMMDDIGVDFIPREGTTILVR